MVHRGMMSPAIAEPPPTKPTAGDTLARAVAGAPIAWLLVSAALVIAGFAGYTPFMTPADLTLPEAAAVRDHLEILRQIESGADPNRAERVRPGLVRPGEYVMTPLEAAVASGRLDTVQFVQQHGARVDRGTLPSLLCFAQLQGADEIASYFMKQAPAHLALSCEGVRLPWTDCCRGRPRPRFSSPRSSPCRSPAASSRCRSRSPTVSKPS